MQLFRVGYVVAPKWVIKAIVQLIDMICIRTSYVSQKALLATLNEPRAAKENRISYHRECRDLVWSELNKIDGTKCNKPMGASYVFPNHQTLDRSSFDFANHLLTIGKVEVIPGRRYGSVSGEGHFRLCFASNKDRLREGLRRIGAACEELNQTVVSRLEVLHGASSTG
jgi:aspartate/methionine/tyrosine aminotransferase